MKKSLILVGALMLSLAATAEEQDPMAVCDEHYSACSAKCDAQENGDVKCYDDCDAKYQKCLDAANGYTPEPEKKEAPAKAAPQEAPQEE